MRGTSLNVGHRWEMNIKERKAHNTTQKRRSRRKNKRSSGKKKMDGWKRKKQAQYNDYAGEWRAKT